MSRDAFCIPASACRQRSTRSNKICDFVRKVRPTRTPRALVAAFGGSGARPVGAHSRPPCVFGPVHARPKNESHSILLLPQQNSCGGLSELFICIQSWQRCFFDTLEPGYGRHPGFFALQRNVNVFFCKNRKIKRFRRKLWLCRLDKKQFVNLGTL